MADNPDVNQPDPQNHLLIKKSENNSPQESYTLYADDNTFPQTSRILQAPELVTTFRKPFLLNSIDGWQFFYGEYVDRPEHTKWAAKWNPITNECFRTEVTPTVGYACSAIGFGVHPVTGLKLVKISFKSPNYGFSRFAVDVCTWDEPVPGEWTNVITDGPFMLSDLVECSKVFVGEVLYFRASDGPVERRTNYFYSFNLVTNVFGVVGLPAGLLHTNRFIQSADVNGSLGLLVSVNQDEDNNQVCDVWTYEEGNQFDMIHTIGFEGNQLYGDVLGFRNNGEVGNLGEAVIELRDGAASIGLYDPLTGHLNGDVGINGNPFSFVVRPYSGNVAYD